MKTFSIDNDNNITAFPTPDHAEAAVDAGSQPFTSQQQLTELASAWPAERLVEIWNSLPGVETVKGRSRDQPGRCPDRQSGAERASRDSPRYRSLAAAGS